MFINLYNEFKHHPLCDVFDLLKNNDTYLYQIMMLKASLSSALSLIGFKLDELYISEKSNIKGYFDNKKITLLRKLDENSIKETFKLLRNIRHSSAHLYHEPLAFYVNDQLLKVIDSHIINKSQKFAVLDNSLRDNKLQITLFGSIVLIAAFLSKLERVFFFRQLFDDSAQDVEMIRKQIEIIPSTENLKFNKEKSDSRKLRFIYKFLTLPTMLLMFKVERYFYELNPSSIERSSRSLLKLLINNDVKSYYARHLTLLRKSVLHGNFFGKELSNHRNQTTVKSMLTSIKSIYTWEIISHNNHLKEHIADLLEIFIKGKYLKLDAQMSYFRKKRLQLKDLKLTNQIYGTIIDWHSDVTEEDENTIYYLLTIYSNREINTREIYIYHNALPIEENEELKKNLLTKKTSIILIGKAKNYENLKQFTLNLSNDFKLIFKSRFTKIYSNE